MRKEYDFSGGVVGKYAKPQTRNTSIVLLDADVAFPDSKSVNDALRTLIKIAEPNTLNKAALSSGTSLATSCPTRPRSAPK